MTSLLVIGGGNMGAAIVRGGIARGVLLAEQVCIIEPDVAKHAGFAALGPERIECHTDLAAGAEWLGTQTNAQVLLAVKPQMLGAVGGVGESWKRAGLERWSGVVITILAGVPGARVRDALGPATRIVRAMPNLPAAIGEGATALCASAGMVAGDDAFAEKLFAGIGPVVIRTREELIDAFTAAAGSGPAYVFALAEAMEAAAQRQGFDAESARTLVNQTIKGAALMLAESGESAATLRARVTSKGGTTEAALATMQERGFSEAIALGMNAAAARAKELARG